MNRLLQLPWSISLTTSKTSPKFFVWFFFLFCFLKLTYKEAMCPFLAQLAGRTLRMTFVIWCNTILFIHPILGRFGASAPLLTPETILCLRLSDTAGCSGGNAAEKRWARSLARPAGPRRSMPGPKAGVRGGGCFLGKPSDW